MTMYFVHNKTTPIKQQQQQRRPDAHLSQWSEQLVMRAHMRNIIKLTRDCRKKLEQTNHQSREHMTPERRAKGRRRRQGNWLNLSPAASLILLLVNLAAYLTTPLEATHQDGVTQERGGSDASVQLREDQVHRLMSDQDLRRTFHVDSHDQVPEYQILKLTVQTDGSHLISPISDLGELTGELHNTNKRHHLDDDDDDGTRETSSEAEQLHKRNKRATEDAKLRQQQQQQQQQQPLSDKLIVMNLSTFGRDFSLRLKRNADFQQRIKDMKMFLAESTGNGQLRYTEIKSSAQQQQHQQQQQQHKQEPHKRAADSQAADELLQGGASDNKPATTSAKTTPAVNSTTTTGDKLTKGQHQQQQADHWNIGATYHDEDNLAALLIDHDRLTGQLQVDGTIGNDFVIKPMPRATIEALRVASSSSSSSSKKQQSSHEPLKEDLVSRVQQNSSTASHLHDDDPHDDDEMFLDEDEALELAHLQASVSTESNHTAGQVSTSGGNNVTQPRTLSKAASERKWKKYRKLMAQTQVPKMGAGSSGTSGGERARRHAQGARMSHHIIFKQRPSSEGSSSEHKHSFMLAPGQQSMEEMVRRFPVGGSQSSGRALNKRALEEEHEGDNMIDAKSRLAGADFATPTLTDMEPDPMGGQFYLEPGSISGLARAGHSDWSLIAPYALNSSGSTLEVNTTHAHARHKRHAPLPIPIRAGRHPRGAPGQRRHKRQAPETVWPEVLLVVDYDSFLLHGGDSREVKRYFVSFWNGVDLRYKLLVNPHIRISLAGMIVAKDRDATPYLERNRLRSPNADAVDAAGALTDMGKYLYREDRLPTYDLAVVITKLDMCRRRYEGGRCNRGTAGFAYVGGACVVNKRLEKVNSVAIIEDSGGFSGIIVAAHEVGHLLGCVHDGSPPPSYLGGPGATHCPWEDGFIMSDLRHTERGFRWSQCSVEQFKHFLNGETATCLYNYPHESQMLHRLLPGSMLSLDDQCKRDRGTNACFKDARVCAQLFCFDSASGYCVSYRPAAEGSPCGDGHVCRNGKCVGEIENIIPDYTHQTQTVVARGQRAPLVSAGPPVVAAHPSARLADNGLSASSTSTATSSPDNNKTTGSAGVPQISSRMDTFAPIDEYQNQHQQQHISTTNAARRRASYANASPPTTAQHQLRSSSTPTAKQLARYSNYQPTIDLGLSATATTATLAASSPPRKLTASSTTSGQLAKRSHQRTNTVSVISNAHSPSLSTTSQSLNTRRQQSIAPTTTTTTTTRVQNLPIDNQRLLYQSAGVQQPNEAPLANYDFYRQAYGPGAGPSPTQSAYVAALMAH